MLFRSVTHTDSNVQWKNNNDKSIIENMRKEYETMKSEAFSLDELLKTVYLCHVYTAVNIVFCYSSCHIPLTFLYDILHKTFK